MKIVFIGTVEFSRLALERLVHMKAEVVGICTMQESKINADYYDLSNVGKIHGIPCHYTKDVNSVETLEWIENKSPDVIFCFGWSKLLKQDLLNITPMGVVGFHPAALPENRGRHPIIWALALGLNETASTFFFMDEGADSGDILSQREITIENTDDARSLYDKVTETALMQIEEFVPQLTAGNFQRREQDLQAASTWRKREEADGEIDWRMSAYSIHNLVRGLARPYIGAHFVFGDQKIRVWKSEIVKGVEKNIEPGKVISSGSDGRSVIKCGEDAIRLIITDPVFGPPEGSYI